MAAVRASNSGDVRGMAGHRQPVLDCGADPAPAALSRRSFTSGHEQDDALVPPDRAVDRLVDRYPGRVQRHSMKVERPVGLDFAAPDPPLPVAVEIAGDRPATVLDRAWWQWRSADRQKRQVPRAWLRFAGRCQTVPKRANGRRHPLPHRLFFRAELAHVARHPWATAPRPGPTRSCRRPAARPPRRVPKRCRTGSDP